MTLASSIDKFSGLIKKEMSKETRKIAREFSSVIKQLSDSMTPEQRQAMDAAYSLIKEYAEEEDKEEKEFIDLEDESSDSDPEAAWVPCEISSPSSESSLEAVKSDEETPASSQEKAPQTPH